MKIEDIDLLLGKIRDASGLDEFVVIGSLSALGLAGDGLPPRMTWSMEVDARSSLSPVATGRVCQNCLCNPYFQNLVSCFLRIYRQAQVLPIAQCQDEVLEATKCHLQFDSAMWVLQP